MGGMGFRDLRYFNQALLAKQCFRLSMETRSLLSCVLKARYYKHSNLVETRRGYDPSYTWRSMWGEKSLLLEGLKWRVGNGLSIKVWYEAWMPGNGTHFIPTPRVDSDMALRVSDLIDYENQCWNGSMIKEVFVEEE
ncbi:uncharacterized mitochondrial protein AtMg00310-like [Spinacia oleracea]|uniref:Uncharacterized mitochondrial protein AtMg00310-like n=1 Tax=Spinacia oleracea TaxID=3562 RepID=A0A9R0HYE9_SPIOL|nr:uncharacterized mitochondrial protein AtMg00310-like [Spinacia oleracea]